MTTKNTIDRITEILRSSDLSWLLTNLRQDSVVWNSLNDPIFLDKFLQASSNRSSYQAGDFSPSKLALLALGQNNFIDFNPNRFFDSIDPQILQSAVRSYPELNIQKQHPVDLASAGLIALALMQNYQNINNWNELLSDLIDSDAQLWRTSITCLMGFLQEPIDMLEALVQAGAGRLRFELAIHTVQSNPIMQKDQVSILTTLCDRPHHGFLPASDRLRFLDELQTQNMELAEAFCKDWLSNHPLSSSFFELRQWETAANVDEIAEVMFQIQARKISKEDDNLPNLINLHETLTHNFYLDAMNQILIHRAKGLSDQSSFGSASIADELIRQIEKNILPLTHSLRTQSELALSLGLQGKSDEALHLLPDIDEPLPADAHLLYSIAYLYHQAGVDQHSLKAVLKLLEIFDHLSNKERIPVWGEYLSLVNLGKLLFDLEKPYEAARIFKQALQECPNDHTILKLLALNYSRSNQDELAVDTYCSLVSLHPNDFTYRRDYADSLAKIGLWQDCLEERAIIIKTKNGIENPSSNQDFYKYAHAALKSNHPELALEVCKDFLETNPEDCQAIIYLGQAYVDLHDPEKGLSYLQQATQISPELPDTWLALANAQRTVGPIKTVIDTLNNAALVLPESYQIQFSLGELYLEDNTPTLALPVLLHAYELAPKNPPVLVRYGQALFILGHFDEACEVLSKAYGLDPRFPGLAQMYAKLLLDLGKIEDAISPLELVISEKSTLDPSTYLDYARCILVANKLGGTAHPPMKALIALNEVMQIAPEIIEAKALIAEVLNACGENELAYQAYKDALDTELKDDRKWFERLSYGLGCTANTIGKYDVAIAALQEASLINPDNPSIFIALSDAYLAVDLPEDAIRAARNVVIIDGDNPDNLAWFARQMTKFISHNPQVIHNPLGNISNQITSEILIALNKAIQLAPTRVDLLIQLGNFQSGLGSKDEAKATFVSIATLAFASMSDLMDAARHLSDLHEHSAAIACLEKAIAIDIKNPSNHEAILYKDLAQEYIHNHDQESAINTLNKAIELIHDDNTILYSKVGILLGGGNAGDALNCINDAIQNASDLTPYLDLLFLASRISRASGDLASALKYAQIATNTFVQQCKSSKITKFPPHIRIQIAELYRSLMQPHQAYMICSAEVMLSRRDFENEDEYLDYLCFHTELALELGMQIAPEIQDLQVEPGNAAFIRMAAIKSSLISLSGDSNQAKQLFKFVVNKINQLRPNQESSSWEFGTFRYKQLNSLCEAACRLGFWEYATFFAQEMIDLAKEDPLPLLNYAKSIIMRAEYEQLCDSFDVVEHNTKDASQSTINSSICLQYLEKAQGFLVNYQYEKLFDEYGITFNELLRWRARAAMVYDITDQTDENLNEILNQYHSKDDISAVIHQLHRQAGSDPDGDAMTKIIKIARSYKNEPSVILQVALALQGNNPDSIVRSLQAVLQDNPSVKNPIIAFCNVLLAKTAYSIQDFNSAKQAIELALDFWPDEPRWRALASQICIGYGNTQSAIDHLSEASRLSPMEISYHKDLGRLYLDKAIVDNQTLILALKCFENAVALNQEDVDALVYLATTQYLLNDIESANNHARDALMLAPDREEIYHLLSEIAIQNNDYQGAYEYANKAILISPKDINSTLVLAKSLSALGRHHEAIAKLNSAIPDFQHPEVLYIERVNILYKMAGVRAALNELTVLNNTYPNNYDILNRLARLNVEAGDYEGAMTIAQQALETPSTKSSSNEQANLHLLLGQLLRKSGQLNQSIEHLEEAIRLAPDRLEPYLELGLARKERREYQQALQIFERATTIAPDDPRAPFQAGLALKESKDYKSSETMLRRAVSLAPNDLNIRRQLAAVVALNLVHNPRIGRS